MKVTYNWLKDFVEIKLPARALAEKLTLAGLEVTSLEERDGDFVLEIEVTSNRPDCLSVIGMAREVAAITKSKIPACPAGRKMQKSKIQFKVPNSKKELLKIEIQDKKDCPLYTAKIIRGVKVGPSPDWLKRRLELVGCRSVNNIVDITNYILFTYGEPLHAFDLDKLSGQTILVRRGRAQEKIITIDAVVRTLDPDILVIADAEKPLAIAGIMGGENSEVGNFTTDILLEAAIFSPVLVRRARQKLGLESESSYRFERGIDFQTVQDASDQAAQLIQQLCGGRYALAKSAGLAKVKEKTINLSLAKANQILGTDIPSGKIRNILTGLSFKLRPQGEDMLKVRVPAYRQDVNLEIDLVEEIARIYGYAKIPTTLPEVSLDVITLGRRSLVPAIKNILIGLGLNEVVTYGLIDPQALKDLAGVTPPIEILNPISAQQAVLRPTLIPGLLKSVASNLNQKQPYINIFEVAKVFSGSADRPKEELSLGVALCGLRQVFLRQGVVKEEAGLLHLKGTLESLFSRLGILNYSFHQGQGPGEFDVYIGKEKVGQMRQIVQPLREEFGIKNKDVFVLEVGLESIISEAKLEKRFTALAVYPGIARDISFILRENIPVADLLRAVKERGGALLQEARVVDYYQGRQIPAGFKGLTVSCLYRSPQRTLTEAEVSPIHALVCAVLKDRFSAQIR